MVIEIDPWTIGSTDKEIVVPKGFVTDYASIPGFAQSFIHKQGPYTRAAVIHDYLYWTQACTRLQADNLLWIAMSENEVPPVKQWLIFHAVRWLGGTPWHKNAHEKAHGGIRYMPDNYRHVATTMTFPAAMKFLVAKGVRDPSYPVSPAACMLGNQRKVP